MKCVSAPRPSVESRELSTCSKKSARCATKAREPREERRRAGRGTAASGACRRYGIASTRNPQPSPSRPLRESVARSTSTRKSEQEGERHAEPVTALEPEVDREEEQDPGRDLDAEVVRVARQRVDAVDERALDRAEDVDLAVAAGDRLQPRLVEVRAGRLGDGELQQPVGAVRREPADERGEREPVERSPRRAISATPAMRNRKWRRNLIIPFAHWASDWAVSRLNQPIR